MEELLGALRGVNPRLAEKKGAAWGMVRTAALARAEGTNLVFAERRGWRGGKGLGRSKGSGGGGGRGLGRRRGEGLGRRGGKGLRRRRGGSCEHIRALALGLKALDVGVGFEQTQAQFPKLSMGRAKLSLSREKGGPQASGFAPGIGTARVSEVQIGAELGHKSNKKSISPKPNARLRRTDTSSFAKVSLILAIASALIPSAARRIASISDCAIKSPIAWLIWVLVS